MHGLKTPLRQAMLSHRIFNAPVPAELRRPLYGGVILFMFLGMAIYDLYQMRNYQPLPLSGLGNTARQLAYMLMFVMAAITLRLNQDLRQVLVLPASMMVLLAWCWASSLWAVDSSIAVRRLALTTISIWTIFVCVEHAGYERSIRMARWLLLATLFLNYVEIVISPLAIEPVGDYADPAIAGTWRGILAQKNFAGATCAMLILLCLFGPRKSQSLSHTAFKWGVVLASAYFLYRTNSKTSMGVLVISILLGVIYGVFGSRNRLWLIPLFGASCIAAGMIAAGRLDLYDPTAFTGRAQIWLMVLNYIHEHPWLGSGFGSFWNIGSASPVYHYTHGWIAKSATAHNGYLDIVVQLGYPGFALAMIAMVLVPAWILLSNTMIPSPQGSLLVACFFFCIGHNFTESTILTTNFIVELFFLIILALIFQSGRLSRTASPSPLHDARSYAEALPLARGAARQMATR
jgi:O-antigen ligase